MNMHQKEALGRAICEILGEVEPEPAAVQLEFDFGSPRPVSPCTAG